MHLSFADENMKCWKGIKIEGRKEFGLCSYVLNKYVSICNAEEL
jgi:hypothetical protein